MDSLVVSGTTEGAVCDMIIETGSNITILRPDILKRVSKDVVLDLHPVDSCLRTVTGETTPVRSRGRVVLQIGNFKTSHDVWIAEIENECILGLDFLVPNDCIVDMTEACLRIGTEEIQFQRLGLQKKQCAAELLLQKHGRLLQGVKQ